MRVQTSLVPSIVILLFLFSACAAPKTAGSLDHTLARENTLIIALIKPHYTGPLQVNARGGIDAGPNYTIPQTYINESSLRIQNSMLIDIQIMLRAKGFIIDQSYESFNQISDADLQKIVSIVVPTFDFGPQVTNQENTVNLPYLGESVTHSGIVQLIGKITIAFVDPMSKEKILTKTVEVTSLGSIVEMEYENKTAAEKQFTEMLDKNYPLLMAKVEKIINADELRSALKDSSRLKKKGR